MKFRIWKLDIRDLGDSTIFPGINGSISIDASKSIGMKRNHIYFTDNWKIGDGRDMGSYHLKDGTIRSFYPCVYVCPPPTWLIPSL